MLDDRKLEVLRAIVTDFVSSNEPVGSKALAERHGLGVSPATVRNDMAALEDEGYITHPHTSAGRIPTDKGYRLFVDRLSHGQAAVQRRAAGHPELPRGRGRPRRRRAPHGAPARPADPPGRGRAVPQPVAQRGAPPRDRPPRAEPAAAGAHHRHRPGRAARARAARRAVEDDVAQLRQSFGARLHGARLVDVPAALADLPDAAPPAIRPGADQRHVGGARDAGRAARGARRARRHRQPDPLRAGLPAHPAARPRVARGAGGAAQAHRRGQRPDDRDGARSARRTASRACGPRRS